MLWAHQAAEKAIKALLIARDVDPPKLPDLDRLVSRLPEVDALAFDGLDLPELSRWAIDGRYPADLDEATSADAGRAIDLATVGARRGDGLHRRPDTVTTNPKCDAHGEHQADRWESRGR